MPVIPVTPVVNGIPRAKVRKVVGLSVGRGEVVLVERSLITGVGYQIGPVHRGFAIHTNISTFVGIVIGSIVLVTTAPQIQLFGYLLTAKGERAEAGSRPGWIISLVRRGCLVHPASE